MIILKKHLCFLSVQPEIIMVLFMIKHKYKNIWITISSEFSKYGNGLQIYKNFLDMCGHKYYDLAYDDIPEVKHKNSNKFLD